MGENGPHPADFPCEYDGHVYHVTNEEVSGMFLGAPDNFLPQFGGFCATAMSMGVKAPVDWKLFKVEEEKLFLFHNEEAKAKWEGDPSLKEAANAKWANPAELKDPPAPEPEKA